MSRDRFADWDGDSIVIEKRADQHLPGQHDQESHGGGAGGDDDFDDDFITAHDDAQSRATDKILDAAPRSDHSAIDDYVEGANHDMNEDLRTGKDVSSYTRSGGADLVAELDSQMRPVPDNVIVYRSAGKVGESLARSVKSGDVITDLGFTSTSTQEAFARKWSAKVGGTQTYFRIQVEKGTPAIWIKGAQRELLLGRKGRYEVLDVYDQWSDPINESGTKYQVVSMRRAK